MLTKIYRLFRNQEYHDEWYGYEIEEITISYHRTYEGVLRALQDALGTYIAELEANNINNLSPKLWALSIDNKLQTSNEAKSIVPIFEFEEEELLD